MPNVYRTLVGLIAIASCPAASAHTPSQPGDRPGDTVDRDSRHGYELLTTKAYLPPDFDQETFDELWKTWEEPLRSRAACVSAEERRGMAFQRYGLTSAPGDASHKPQQYVVDEHGNWTMNCLACHQGQVAGQVIPGAPNSLFELETLTDEIRQTKLRLGKPLAHMEIGGMLMPLGTTQGTTNAVMFGVALMARRDAELNLRPLALPPKMTHHDHDAPPWWHFHKKPYLYIDGFAPKGHRALMQFMLAKENGPEKFRQWEDDFRDVYAWLDSLRPPAYPFPIDCGLASEGETVFMRHCAECHGTYGAASEYPNKIVAIEEVATDRVRLDALSPEHRAHYAESWFARLDTDKVIVKPEGYLAPPLDGVWASAPYLHNGSVPTLWHLLHSDQRPKIWRRSLDGYDQEKVGLEIQTFETLPAEAEATPHERRHYFDTRNFGKSAAGHLFQDALTEAEKLAVLEYLKTL